MLFFNFYIRWIYFYFILEPMLSHNSVDCFHWTRVLLGVVVDGSTSSTPVYFSCDLILLIQELDLESGQQDKLPV